MDRERARRLQLFGGRMPTHFRQLAVAPRNRAVFNHQVDVHNSGTSNNGAIPLFLDIFATSGEYVPVVPTFQIIGTLDSGEILVEHTSPALHISGTSNNGANMRAISMLRNIGTSGEYVHEIPTSQISGTSNNGANMRAISMLRNIGTSGEYVHAIPTLQISGTSNNGANMRAISMLSNVGTAEEYMLAVPASQISGTFSNGANMRAISMLSNVGTAGEYVLAVPASQISGTSNNGANMRAISLLSNVGTTGEYVLAVPASQISATSNNGANMRAISMLSNVGTAGEYVLAVPTSQISSTSNNGANMRAISMLRNIGTFRGYVHAVSTLQTSGTSNSGEIELAVAGPTLCNNGTSDNEGFDQYNNCLQVTSLGALHSKFQSLFNAGMYVSRCFLSWGQELKCLASLMATKITEVLSLSRNREIVGFRLPSYRQDLRGNTPLEENSSTRKAFLCYVRDNFRDMPPKYRMAALGLCCAYLISLIKNTAPFEKKFQLEKTTNAPSQPLLLTFGEAYGTFYDEIYLITSILVGIIACMVLSYPLPAGVQVILFMGLVIIPAFSYIPNLVHKASKTGVAACGSIKLPLFWTIVLWAVLMSLFFGLIALVLFYILWLRSGRNPRVEAADDASLDGFAEAFQE